MRNWRYAHTDPDIHPELIQSEIIKKMLGKYDAYTEDNTEIFFIDPYENFFFSIADLHDSGVWEHDMGEFLTEDGTIDEAYWDMPLRRVELPVIRVIYIIPHRRRQGRLQRIAEDIKEVSDATGESIALFADPFRISGYGRELNARESFKKFMENGYEPTENFAHDLIKLRSRYMDLGFRNIKFSNAQLTKPYQHLAYISKNAPAAERQLLESLEVEYVVNPDLKLD